MNTKNKQRKKQNLFQKTLVEEYEYLKSGLENYNPALLDSQPATPQTLYKYYTNIDKVYTWLRMAYDDDLSVLCNEMRAILGHLSEYDVDDDKQKRNLDKAYSHFRRLSIDTLKILCNGLDQVYDEWIQKYAKHDFRKIDNSFLPQYIELYHEAHSMYLNVQRAENLGSDRDNAIIQKYHGVALKYLELHMHHINPRRIRIEKNARRFELNNRVFWFATIIFTSISIIDAIMAI